MDGGSIPIAFVVGSGYAFVAGEITTALTVHAAVPRLIGDAENVVFVLFSVLVVVLETVFVGLDGDLLVLGQGAEQSPIDLYVRLRIGVDYGWLQGKRIGLIAWNIADWIIDRAIKVMWRKISWRVIDNLRWRSDLKLNDIGLIVHKLIVLDWLTWRRKRIRLATVLIDFRPLRFITHLNKTV